MDARERDELITKHYGLVAQEVDKYLRANAGFRHLRDDLISGGTIGLIRGIDEYSWEKAAALTTFARISIRSAILDVTRTEATIQNPQKRLRKYEISRIDTDLDAIPAQEDPKAEDLAGKLAGLCRNEFERLLCSLMTTGKTTEAIAAEMMVAPRTVRRRKALLLQRLRKR